MGSNIIELAKLGHERAAELKASCGAVDVRSLAQLISDLATQLEVQFVRSTNMAVQLANAGSKCRELAAENAEMRSSIDATIGWQESTDPENGESVRMLVDIKTPATDAFLTEVRAQGVEMAMEHMQSSGSLTFGDCYISLNEFAAQLRQGAAL
ncbi:hypothetical protein [Citrobacter freundii]|uniref:hypothetical protein n=1 Tax=Citrobacter freundii TaxID=546 RepID=UPI00259E844D|nr:hypothetical protein [Citrobacter freundii]EJK5499886.1 hypothetical protein [Citrobacter freundii]EKU1724143.1 hypothetical protein [Citrobacter freundii]EKV0354819.1 hypothetical protein [Citrobacter freundii]EKV0475137.1 hypothetical protein [Citrobacter freundii]